MSEQRCPACDRFISERTRTHTDELADEVVKLEAENARLKVDIATLQEDVGRAEAELSRADTERQEAEALAERRGEALRAQEAWEEHWPACDDCYAAENLGGSETERRDRCERGAFLLGHAASERLAAIAATPDERERR